MLAALILASSALMVLDVGDGDSSDGPLGAVRSAVGDVAGPLQEQAAALPRAAGSLRDGDARAATSPRVAALEQQNALLAAQADGGYDRRRAAELDGLLRVAGLAQYPLIPARVVAIGPVTGFGRSVTIDAGRLDGLRSNLTVLNADGLVGRLTAVGRTTSTVVLTIDASTTVGVRLENQQAGYAQGGGGAFDAPLTVDLFSPNAEVGPGDRLATFGSADGAPYVAGVPVGEVTEVKGLTGSLTKRVLVRPYVDFGALDLVGVVLAPPRTDPRTVLLPPRTGSPAPRSTAGPDTPRVLDPPAASSLPRPSSPPRAVAEKAQP